MGCRDLGNHRAKEDPEAVQEVLSGDRKVANAAWWGFNEIDSTDSIQNAIASGARRVVIPDMNREWIVRPIDLVGDMELVLEPGTVITAKRGEFRGSGDKVFRARDISNLSIRGYGATIRMQKEDYIVGKVLVDLGWDRWFGTYEKAEWRTPLSLEGCSNVKVNGLKLCDSGGDGIYIDGGDKLDWSRNISIQDVTCDNNYRQGMSVISVNGLDVKNSTFSNTWGTPPSAGVDIEPDSSDERIQNVVFRDCSFRDNYGDGIEVFLSNLRKDSGEVSILFERCRVTSKRGSGIRVTKVPDNGPDGKIEFRDCVIENTQGYGIKVQDKSADRARVRFVRCKVRDAARNPAYKGAWSPIWLDLFRTQQTTRFGGIDFVDCRVEDDYRRPVVRMTESESDLGLRDVTGTLNVLNPCGVEESLGSKREEVDLNLREVKW